MPAKNSPFSLSDVALPVRGRFEGAPAAPGSDAESEDRGTSGVSLPRSEAQSHVPRDRAVTVVELNFNGTDINTHTRRHGGTSDDVQCLVLVATRKEDGGGVCCICSRAGGVSDVVSCVQ